jgi:hypothetical protein
MDAEPEMTVCERNSQLKNRALARLKRNRDAAIHVYDEAGTVIETHEQAGDFKKW